MWSCITTMVWSWKLLAEYKKPEDNTRFLHDTIHTAWRWLRNQCCHCSYRWLWRLIPTMVRCTSTMETCFLMKESMRPQLQGTNYPCVPMWFAVLQVTIARVQVRGAGVYQPNENDRIIQNTARHWLVFRPSVLTSQLQVTKARVKAWVWDYLVSKLITYSNSTVLKRQSSIHRCMPRHWTTWQRCISD